MKVDFYKEVLKRKDELRKQSNSYKLTQINRI